MRSRATPNEPLHVTAARLRFLLNLNGPGGAAARERGRWADKFGESD